MMAPTAVRIGDRLAGQIWQTRMGYTVQAWPGGPALAADVDSTADGIAFVGRQFPELADEPVMDSPRQTTAQRDERMKPEARSNVWIILTLCGRKGVRVWKVVQCAHPPKARSERMTVIPWAEASAYRRTQALAWEAKQEAEDESESPDP